MASMAATMLRLSCEAWPARGGIVYTVDTPCNEATPVQELELAVQTQLNLSVPMALFLYDEDFDELARVNQVAQLLAALPAADGADAGAPRVLSCYIQPRDSDLRHGAAGPDPGGDTAPDAAPAPVEAHAFKIMLVKNEPCAPARRASQFALG